MRSRSNLLVLLGIAFFVVGGVIVYLITQDEQDGGSGAAQRVQVVVASTDITAGELADELIEAGWLTSDTRDDPLLKDRVIVMTHAINEHSSQLIVKALLRLDSQDHTKPIDLYLSSPGGWGGSAFTVIEVRGSACTWYDSRLPSSSGFSA